MRHDEWQSRFWKNLKAARALDFSWGNHDCVMFATSSIDAVMGTDYYAQAKIRYPYSTEAEAREWMATVGGITGLVGSFLGDPVNWGQLTCGDVCLVAALPMMGTDMEMLTVHDGTNLVGPSHKGLLRVPFAYAVHGWKLR